ncbi:PEG10: Retrotransposon-derived protein PEG10 [Crotalus adamanteus]|uniref:PEG10: Retrotransposon-derived protein PEG10 n=1 Tax=Crotalus adamanteus TaxID=8729 RepID=A0AAW1B1A0_CROAD
MYMDDLLCFRDCICVPGGPLRGIILKQCHDSLSAGHFRVFKTLHLVSRMFWWLRLWHDVSSYVASCSICRQATKLPPSKGATTILVVVDMLTKMAHFIPCVGLPTARFAYNNAQHASARVSPFFASYGFHPRLFPLAPSDSPVLAVDKFLQELKVVYQVVRHQLEKAKEDYKRFADRHWQDVPLLSVGDRVWLFTQHLPTARPSKNLDHCYLGPFMVEVVINLVAQPAPPLPGPATSHGDMEYEVDSIQDSRRLRGQFHCLVAWKGATDVHAPRLVCDFNTRFPHRPSLHGPGGGGPAGGG